MCFVWGVCGGDACGSAEMREIEKEGDERGLAMAAGGVHSLGVWLVPS